MRVRACDENVFGRDPGCVLNVDPNLLRNRCRQGNEVADDQRYPRRAVVKNGRLGEQRIDHARADSFVEVTGEPERLGGRDVLLRKRAVQLSHVCILA